MKKIKKRYRLSVLSTTIRENYFGVVISVDILKTMWDCAFKWSINSKLIKKIHTCNEKRLIIPNVPIHS